MYKVPVPMATNLDFQVTVWEESFQKWCYTHSVVVYLPAQPEGRERRGEERGKGEERGGGGWGERGRREEEEGGERGEEVRRRRRRGKGEGRGGERRGRGEGEVKGKKSEK